MTPPPADFGNFAAGSLGGASRSASFIQASRGGLESISGSHGTDALHNFSNENADGDRIVLVGIGGGLAIPFLFVRVLSHGGQYD